MDSIEPKDSGITDEKIVLTELTNEFGETKEQSAERYRKLVEKYPNVAEFKLREIWLDGYYAT